MVIVAQGFVYVWQGPERGTAKETVDRAALHAHVHAEVCEDRYLRIDHTGSTLLEIPRTKSS